MHSDERKEGGGGEGEGQSWGSGTAARLTNLLENSKDEPSTSLEASGDFSVFSLVAAIFKSSNQGENDNVCFLRAEGSRVESKLH